MADENCPTGTLTFTSAAIRYVAPSFTRQDINYLMCMVSGQLCLVNEEPRDEAFYEAQGIYAYQMSELYRKMQQLQRYMEKFDIPEIQFCIPGEDTACTDQDVKIELNRL